MYVYMHIYIYIYTQIYIRYIYIYNVHNEAMNKKKTSLEHLKKKKTQMKSARKERGHVARKMLHDMDKIPVLPTWKCRCVL